MSAADNATAAAGSAAPSMGMGASFQTIAMLVLFIAVLAVLPWLLRRWQQRQLAVRGQHSVHTQVLSAVMLSPGQRVVVVEVGQGDASTRLVLGVTAHNIHCLHVLGSGQVGASSPTSPMAVGAAPAAASFASAMAHVQQAPGSAGTH